LRRRRRRQMMVLRRRAKLMSESLQEVKAEECVFLDLK